MRKKKKLSYFITLGTLTTLGIAIYNKLQFILSTSYENLYLNNSNYYSWRFGKIFYTVKGSGSPILLIHDLNSSSSSYEWKHVIDQFSKSYTVYAVDLIGCGRSDKPIMTYTSYLYVQLLTDFIKTIIKHKTAIIATGHSTSIAIMACYIEPQLFENIILVNPENITTSNKYPKTRDKLLKYIIETPILGTFIYNLHSSKSLISKNFNKKLFNNPSKISKKYINAYRESAHLGGYSSKYLYSSIFCKYTNTNVSHALKKINNNIQLIFGANEPLKDITIQYYTELNPSIEIDTIPDTKHLPQLENPEKFIECSEIYL